jgi:hypothetical protein
MSTPSLVAVLFGENQIMLRRHWGGDAEIAGMQVLDHLHSAYAVKPRGHFHTGSWLIRILMQDGDEGGSSLPTYELAANPEGFAGDWEKAYVFKARPDSDDDLNDSGRVENWSIGYVEDAHGEPLQELMTMAKWFTPAEFRSFVDEEMQKGIDSGKTYDFQLRDAFRRSMPPDAEI